ncbi:MAG: thioredoxin-disulfide reductase [Clostridia bacterium]|nr:thioredoxin-disulfide reductase [Clostridia bacterium]
MAIDFEKVYDVAVVGAGPAGLTAALYCGRAGFNTLMLEKLSPGGQMATTNEIENYPGFPGVTDGFTLAMNMSAQAEQFGVQQDYAEVTALRIEDDIKLLETAIGTIRARSVILAPGAAPRLLGLPNENMLRGKGVSYCATCDGAFYRKKTVAVVGGGDTAAADAVFLSSICEKVYLIHRRDQLRASKSYTSKLDKENIEFVWDSVVEEILENGRVCGIRVRNVKTNETREIELQGLFVAVGNIPATDFLRGAVELDEAGYFTAGEDTKTNVPGVFAAGDCRRKPLRQIVTAAADGAVAAYAAEEYLS